LRVGDLGESALNGRPETPDYVFFIPCVHFCNLWCKLCYIDHEVNKLQETAH